MSQVDRYSCEQTFRRLDDYLDRALSESETRLVREHLETCAVCAHEFRFEAGVLDGVRRAIACIEVPPDLLTRIQAALARAGT
jgi:anti-sigma factor (TIGR02949 family)